MDAAAAGAKSAADTQGPTAERVAAFEAFFRQTEPKLRRALVAAYGPDAGLEQVSSKPRSWPTSSSPPTLPAPPGPSPPSWLKRPTMPYPTLI